MVLRWYLGRGACGLFNNFFLYSFYHIRNIFFLIAHFHKGLFHLIFLL